MPSGVSVGVGKVPLENPWLCRVKEKRGAKRPGPVKVLSLSSTFFLKYWKGISELCEKGSWDLAHSWNIALNR